MRRFVSPSAEAITRRIRPLITLTLLLFSAACSHHQDLARPSTQDNFGVQMAKMNLWREALFRFQRAVQINPQDAMAHNNLAVAWEANGDFEKARKEYLEALKLDRSNQYIQKNYSRFVEFLSRNRKRQQRETRTASATATPAPSVTPGVKTIESTPLIPGKPEASEAPKPSPPPNATPPSDVPPAPQPPAPQPQPPPSR